MPQQLKSSKFSSALLSVVLLLGFSAHCTALALSADVVGEVISVIGSGTLRNTAGDQAVVRGQLIRAGDQLETALGGHVHVRFVDGGLVSVRPLSRLQIEEYRNRSEQELAAIKFRLDVGVVRSVTGQWGEANKERFRLNTPVAAIGIKGTDFVVKASTTSTLVSVNTGAIVMAPLEGSCGAGLGPCSGERSALLTADMQGKMLEYLKQSDKSVPRLVPYVDLLTRNTAPLPGAERGPVEMLASADLANKTQSKGTEVANRMIDQVAKEAIVKDAATRGPEVKDVVAPANPIADAGVTPVPAKAAKAQLVWLHNAAEWNVPANTISTRFDEASAAGKRETVGNFFITLYRDETTKKDFSPPSATASFNLQNVSANYVQPLEYGRPIEKIAVTDAKLTVDFAKSSLSTQLNLSSPSMGRESFIQTASISSDGLITGNGTNQSLAGAFSTDGTQAGYYFEKRLFGGTASGLTLWGR